MAGVRDIRRRIRSVRNMEQITKAMKMVAAAKLRKAQEKVIAARPYSKQLHDVLARLAQAGSEIEPEDLHPLLQKRSVKRIGYVLVTSDRGLCGGYNANLIRMTNTLITEESHEVKLVTIGRKGRDFYLRGKVETVAQFIGIGEKPTFAKAKEVAEEVMSLYISGELDEVYLVYNEFINAVTQRPMKIKLLPIEQPTHQGSEMGKDYIFEPSPAELLKILLPKYVETQIFSAILEGKASEEGSRMTAMGSATDNAKEMIERLTLVMNRARQAAITTEISEIVGGASALE